MIYFTADLHLGHSSLLKYSSRPFCDVDEMNDSLIQNINDTVNVKDELWILGDFAYKINRDKVRELREQIKCLRVHLIKGNHDRDYSNDGIFTSVQDYKELKTDYGKIILFHYPILDWNAGRWGSVHLHGHIHTTGEYNKDNISKRYVDRFSFGHTPENSDLMLRIYDVGVDANNFRPISLEQIVSIMGLERIKNRPSNLKV